MTGRAKPTPLHDLIDWEQAHEKARSEQVTLPEVRVSRTTPTIPAPKLSEPVTHEQWIELQRVFADLGENERRVLQRIAERLLNGQRLYGELARRGRSWDREQQEELLNAIVYGACALEGVL